MQKNKFNIRGIKIGHLSKLILLASVNKGNAIDLKKEYIKQAFSTRYLLMRKSSKKRTTRKFKKLIYKHFVKKLMRELSKKSVEERKRITKRMLIVRKKKYLFRKKYYLKNIRGFNVNWWL